MDPRATPPSSRARRKPRHRRCSSHTHECSHQQRAPHSLGAKRETVVRLLTCQYRVLSKHPGDSRSSGKGAVSPAERTRPLPRLVLASLKDRASASLGPPVARAETVTAPILEACGRVRTGILSAALPGRCSRPRRRRRPAQPRPSGRVVWRRAYARNAAGEQQHGGDWTR